MGGGGAIWVPITRLPGRGAALATLPGDGPLRSSHWRVGTAKCPRPSAGPGCPQEGQSASAALPAPPAAHRKDSEAPGRLRSPDSRGSGCTRSTGGPSPRSRIRARCPGPPCTCSPGSLPCLAQAHPFPPPPTPGGTGPPCTLTSSHVMSPAGRAPRAGTSWRPPPLPPQSSSPTSAVRGPRFLVVD